MALVEARPVAVRAETSPWVVALDVTAKAVLLWLMVRVALDPAWGNLEGKSPGTRAVTYPLLSLVVPAVFFLRAPPRGGYPWVADLLMTVPRSPTSWATGWTSTTGCPGSTTGCTS